MSFHVKSNNEDFNVQFLFDVEIEGVSIGRWEKVQLPEIEVEEIQHHDGKTKHAMKRPGKVKYGDITLSHGFASDDTLQNWWNNIMKGVADRKSMSIVMYDEEDTEIRRWNCYKCWPKKWKVSELAGKNNEVVSEELVIAIETMEPG